MHECDVDEVSTCRLLPSGFGRVSSVVYVGGLDHGYYWLYINQLIKHQLFKETLFTQQFMNGQSF